MWLAGWWLAGPRIYAYNSHNFACIFVLKSLAAQHTPVGVRNILGNALFQEFPRIPSRESPLTRIPQEQARSVL